MDISVAGVMVSDVEPVIVPDTALIATVPVALDVTSPAVLMAATLGSEELQVTALVRFCVLPSV
jgi:hypothetical protein